MSTPRRKRRLPMAEINIVPYVDVMLVLLVIFMITAPLLTQGVDVNLPQAQAESIEAQDNEPVVVSVNNQGQYFLNIADDPDVPIDSNDLMVRVAAELSRAPERSVLVRGDTEVAYGKVVGAMVLLQQAGAQQVGLVTRTPDDDILG